MARVERRNGSWSTRVSLTDPLTGRRIQPRVTAPTKRELEAAVARLRSEFNAGRWVDPDDTPLAEWIDRWLARAGFADASLVTRRGILRNHIANAPIGAIPLGRLRAHHIQDWLDAKRVERHGQRAGYAPGMLWQMYALVAGACDYAVHPARVLLETPCRGITLPRPATTWAVLSEAETKRLLAGTRDDPHWGAFWMLAATLGIRRGELLVLRWGDIDLDAGRLAIERTLTRDAAGRWIEGDLTKTPHARRRLALPAACVAALRQHRARQAERRLAHGPGWGTEPYVFDDGHGRIWPYPNHVNRALDRALAALELPRVKPHELRHGAATHMLRARLPVTTVARILGHKSAAVTLEIYAHVIAEMESEAAAQLDALWAAEG